MFDTRVESPDLLGSLGTLSAFYSNNSAAERRRLRATIEEQGRNVNEQFLAAAEVVTQASASALLRAHERVAELLAFESGRAVGTTRTAM